MGYVFQVCQCHPYPAEIYPQDAVAALNTLQSNFSIVDAIRKSGRGMNKQAIPEMIDWCQRTGYEVGVSTEVYPALDSG